jgi:hypothetical protein
VITTFLSLFISLILHNLIFNLKLWINITNAHGGSVIDSQVKYNLTFRGKILRKIRNTVETIYLNPELIMNFGERQWLSDRPSLSKILFILMKKNLF